MKRLLFLIFALALVPAYAGFNPFESKPSVTSSRSGDVETVIAKKDGKATYKILYTYDAKNRKIRGEYWAVAEKKKKDEKKAQSNILAGTAMAKSYESALAKSDTKDTSGIELDVEKDGFVLKNVRAIKYNDAGLPVLIMARGYTTYPVVGTFNLKTDYSFTYDNAGRLSSISEVNMNVDSVLLNMGIGNTTSISRDSSGRPLSVKKALGSVPPSVEESSYSYDGNSADMGKTVYKKCSIDTTKLAVTPSETITIEYSSGVPWNGMKKYEFELGKTIKAIKIYDEVAKKNKLDISNFSKLSMIEKAKVGKLFYDLYKNEQQGPRWRMGELPDAPEPFMIYKDYAWYN